MFKLIRKHGELYLVDKDYENHCAIYAYIDHTQEGWLSFIFCNSINPYRASKSIRLEYGQPVAVMPTHPIFKKTDYWNINEDGYDKILINLLSRKNSKFPKHTNWERLIILQYKHNRGYSRAWWNSGFEEMPDYTDIWGICNWNYGDNDPDYAMPVDRNNRYNLGVWATSNDDFGLLVYDDCDRFKAKKIAKISIFAPEYLPYTPNDYACMKTLWRLNSEEKQNLMDILTKSESSGETDYANWHQALSWIDMDGAILAFDGEKQITSIHHLPEDLPLPDYTQLPE